MGGRNEMKPRADLEARIMNRLQTMNRGQTIEQLETYLGEPQSKILAVLMPLQRVGYVTVSKSGVWTLVRA
jgi:DNA-binding IclR family transcriptional regulator